MRKIVHIDMDCFYAAVETKYRPELKGKPLGIGGPPNTRSVLCTANYEARKFGVRSAMPSSQAVRKCPQLVLIPPNFTLYKKESKAVHEILRRYTDKIEPLSLDEAYLDLTGTDHCGGSATLVAQEIRDAIRHELGLTASAGIAPNKFLAKIASDWNKPDGQFVIKPAAVQDFMPGLKVEKLFGVGRVTAEKMHKLGLHTCGDIQRASLADLVRWFGSRAAQLSELARGIDNRQVEVGSERKSLTVEETYNTDLADLKEWLACLPSLFEDWQERMARYRGDSQIRGAVVKVKFFDFQNMTREAAMRETPTLDHFKNLLTKIWRARPEPVRLIGLGVRMEREKTESDESQLSLLS